MTPKVSRFHAAEKLRSMATEVDSVGNAGKIDWSKFFALLVELLPLIIALFAKPDEEKPAA